VCVCVFVSYDTIDSDYFCKQL